MTSRRFPLGFPLGKIALLLFLCAAGAAVSGCATPGAAARAEGLDGLWKTEGYGYLIEIRGDSVQLYEDSAAACVPSWRGRRSGERLRLETALGTVEARLRLEGGELVLSFWGTGERRASRLAAFPPESAGRLARVGASSSQAGRLLSYDALAAAFGEEYGFFDLRGLDWPGRVAELRPRAAAARNDEELFAVMTELLAPLEDGHVNLYAGASRSWSAGKAPAWAGEAQLFVDCIKKNYLAETPEKAANRKLVSARLRGGGAYLCLTGMDGFGPDFERGMAAFEAGLDKALGRLSGEPFLVVDLRFNSGGWDAAGLALASRLAGSEAAGRPVWTKRARSGSGWTRAWTARLSPRPGAVGWGKPIYVLVSGLTASAAETALLDLRALPLVSLVGERTSGAFSDMLPRLLPNGWIATLSNEDFRDPSGASYEARGIEPDILAPMDRAAALAGRDPCLEAVFGLEKLR
jgi:hypothetical protein